MCYKNVIWSKGKFTILFELLYICAQKIQQTQDNFESGWKLTRLMTHVCMYCSHWIYKAIGSRSP